MNIIGFAGKRRSGVTLASTITEDLLLNRGMQSKRLSFLFYVKQVFARANNITVNEIDTTDGMVKRLIDFELRMKPKTFTDMLFRDVKQGDNVIIDGVKYIEHMQAIIERGGVVYRIEVDKALREMRGAKFIEGIDRSLRETDLDYNSDTYRKIGGGVIYNNKTELDLKNELEYVVKRRFTPKIEI